MAAKLGAATLGSNLVQIQAAKMKENRIKWRNHVEKMEDKRPPKK